MSAKAFHVSSKRLFVVLVLTLVLASFISSVPAYAVSTGVVISQVYGGGGNTGATYKNDFIELYNLSASAVDVTGWTVQYASSTGSSWQKTTLSGIIQPGKYFLIQEAVGAGGTVDLPTPNAIGTIAMSATTGKVALVNNSTTLTGTCPTGLVDLVGYGTANCSETSPTAALSNTTAALRKSNGATDTDNNSTDFSVGAPNPRNSPPPDAAPAVNSTVPANGAASIALNSNVTITFSEAVNVSGAWFTISCGSSGAHTAVVTGGPSTFTLNPNADFVPGENCTLTIVATQVSDQDTSDPPDNMVANYTATFSTIGVCQAPFTPIYSIQGSGMSAAITGNVTTQGVVVGDFEGSTSVGIQGFYIQDATGDANPLTSDGIFVYTSNANVVSAGQLVRVTGYARERFDQTTLNGSDNNSAAVPAANIVNCGTGSVLPVDVNFPVAQATDLERFEGMLVRLPQALVIAEYFNYDRFGEIVLALPINGESRPFTPTAIVDPGAPSIARAIANSLRRITLDDGLGSQNPATLRHPNGSAFGLNNRFRGGDTVQNTVGVLGYDFGLYRIQPTGSATYTAANPRPTAPGSVNGASLRVAAMNTLNFFLTQDYPTGNPLDNKCGPLQNVECRGADSDQSQEFTRQRTKLLAALVGLNADIIGLNELENTAGVDPLGDLTNGIVAGLNATLGAGTYAHINTGVIGTDAIRVGVIYKPSKVTPVGAFKLLTTAVDPRFLDTKNRPVLAQTFQVISTGARFTVVVNHLKSKGSDCNDVGDPDTGDGQGNCNVTRKLAAQALVDWLATDPTGSGDPDFLIMGDLNSYAKEDPIKAIRAGADDILGTGDDYTNLIAKYQGAYAYSYVFDGQAGYLDHALASPSLVAQAKGAVDWHINADEPDLLDYDTSFKPPSQDALYEPNAYRSSDHDAVVVGLDLDGTPPTVSVSPNTLWPANHKYVTVKLTVTDNTDPNPSVQILSVTSNEPDNGLGDGDTPNDIVIVNNTTIQLRAERSGTGTGRVYTINYKATDAYGNSKTASVTVTVPQSQGK